MYVVTDLPERRGPGYRPDYDDARRDRYAGPAGDGPHGGARPPAHGGISPPLLGPEGLPIPGRARLRASVADDGGGYQQVPGNDRGDPRDPKPNGALPAPRNDAPRMPGPPLELPAASHDARPGSEGDPVPVPIDAAVQPAIARNLRNEDNERTSPLPVILPGATSVPRPEPVVAPRGPFEAARPSRPTSVTGSVEPPPAANAVIRPAAALAPLPPLPQPAGLPPPAAPSPAAVPERPRHVVPEAAAAKLDQLKDLYFAAEAIGDERLDKHFDQVSQRQRELIREFFERSDPTG
ncbi:MAG: hypothetical protein ACLQFR_09360 [Streptosporangiaceae bacterium]